MSRESKMAPLVLGARAFAYATFAAAFVWPLAQPSAAMSAALFAALGVVASPKLAESPLRVGWVVAAGPLGASLGQGFTALLARSSALAELFGAQEFLRFIDGMRFGLGAFFLALGLCAASARLRWLAFVEVALGGMVASMLVADHRHGAINRPFEIADPILSAGGDPTYVFYLLGAVAVVLLAVVLISERKWWRLGLHMLVLLLIVSGLGFGVTTGALPTPEPAGDGLGLKGKPEEQQKQGQGGRGSQNRPDNDMLEFRDQEPNRDQQTPVAVVLLHDDYSSPSGMYYFRQGAFSQFNGRRLVAATRDSLDRDVVPSFPVDETEVPDAPEPGRARATVETTVALLADHTRPFGLESPVRFTAAQNPNPERFRRVYTVVSSSLTADFMSLLGTRAGSRAWSAEDRRAYLELPSDPRYGELATKLLSELPRELGDDPMLKAWVITEWLSKEATYSLNSKHANADDPTADFLFGDKIGYCVHFAHAVTYLLRAAGVPSRVATGYAVEESGRQGGSAILIPSGAAHAWPEVYLDGVGWVVTDVHPERTLDPAPEPPDADLQRLLGQLARGIRPLPPDGTEPATYWKEWLRDLGRKIVQTAGYAVVLALFALYALKLWRFLAPYFTGGDALFRVAYRAELDRLSEVGLTRRRGESREAFARRVRALVPSFEPLTALHVGARFGSERVRERGSAEVAKTCSQLRAERHRAFGMGKRLWGALKPFSILSAR